MTFRFFIAYLISISCTLILRGQSTFYEQMVLVEGGTFQMGNEEGSSIEKPVHTVTLSDYYISRYEVTVAEYLAFVEATSSNHPEWLEPNSRYNIHTGFDDQYSRMEWGEALTEPTHPIVGISWNDAVAYCAWLSEKEGKNYRLPTEAEWEFAAKGGNASNGYEYAGGNELEEVAWVKSNANESFHSVGQKKANELGLYDMNGNVWEWCHNIYEDYTADSQTNPQGPENGVVIVFRGGGYSSSESRCTPTTRNDNSKVARLKGIGFRIACSK
ncbi:MAG: formylglycine-generating enzyme family protein [Bacteroidota bacterium]